MNIEDESGWAVVDDGTIMVDTVSATRRAAIVNWLIIKCGLQPPHNWTDLQIEDLWQDRRGSGAMVKIVAIRATEDRMQ